MNKKPRSTTVTLEIDKSTTVDGLRIYPNGKIEFLNNDESIIPKEVYSDISYKRKKSPKVLSKVSQNPENFGINHYATLQNFDFIFAIDTNTKEYNNQNLSVSCVVQCYKKQLAPDTIKFEFTPINFFEFRNIKEKQENIAWGTLIELIMKSEIYNNKIKIGIVVDSDLGNILKMNNKQLPIFSNLFLPSNFELLYASADTGKEFLLNKLISMCDKQASMFMDKIINCELPNKKLEQINNKPYTHFRLW